MPLQRYYGASLIVIIINTTGPASFQPRIFAFKVSVTQLRLFIETSLFERRVADCFARSTNNQLLTSLKSFHNFAFPRSITLIANREWMFRVIMISALFSFCSRSNFLVFVLKKRTKYFIYTVNLCVFLYLQNFS